MPDMPQEPLYIAPTPAPDKRHVRAIRSQHTHTLLGYMDEQGIYVFDRRSNTQHLIPWDSCGILDNKNKESA